MPIRPRARINQGLEELNEKVHDNEHECAQQNDASDDGEIAVADRGKGDSTKPRSSKHCLDKHSAPEH